MQSDYPVEIVPYDIQWPLIFNREKANLLNVIGNRVLAIEHIGSTSVPELAAKPVIDLMIGTRDLIMADQCIEPLLSLDYEYVPRYEVVFPERRYFHRGPHIPNQHFHVHMVAIDSDFWKVHLLFRDYLRLHPETAKDYQTLKQDLAKKYGYDQEGYTDAKTEFITQVVQLAKAGSLRSQG